jgi:threonine/homoserine/homoserine lactone efflux protein
MVPVGHVLAFAAVVAVLITIPGPSVLFTSIAATGRKD